MVWKIIFVMDIKKTKRFHLAIWDTAEELSDIVREFKNLTEH